jgi:hypothetical protein
MSDFPSYNPQSRSYTPGSYAAIQAQTLNGDEVSVRRTNAAVNHTLRMTFISSTAEQQDEIFKHYGVNNRFQPFDLPSIVLQGSGLSFPSGYQWIYAGPPEVSYEPGSITVSVELQLIPPYEV